MTATCWSTRAATWSTILSLSSKGLEDGKVASNWIQQSVLRTLNEEQISIDQFPVSAEGLAALIKVVLAGKMKQAADAKCWQR